MKRQLQVCQVAQEPNNRKLAICDAILAEFGCTSIPFPGTFIGMITFQSPRYPQKVSVHGNKRFVQFNAQCKNEEYPMTMLPIGPLDAMLLALCTLGSVAQLACWKASRTKP